MLKIYIVDKRLFDLFYKMFKCKILIGGKNRKFGKVQGVSFLEENLGDSQENILAPILCNIYLSALDTFIEKLKLKYECGVQSTVNPAYLAIVKLSVDELKLSKKEQLRLLSYRKKLARNKGLHYSLLDDKFVRIKYVRYVDTLGDAMFERE